MPNPFLDRPARSSSLVLRKNEVHIWLVQANDERISLKDFENLLSSAEQVQASRFKFATDRRRYVTAHAALRSILSIYVKSPPEKLQFASGPNGKPKLAPIHAKQKFEFNLSHSHEVALIAVTQGREIGVDVEWIREDFAFYEVAQRFFTAKEVTALTALPSQLQRLAFFKCWTSKEAFLKAKGTGLSGELDEVEITLTPKEGVRVNGTISSWTLVALSPCAGYVGALALEGPECQLRCFQWRQLANDLTHRHS